MSIVKNSCCSQRDIRWKKTQKAYMKLGAVLFAAPGWVRWVCLLGGSSSAMDVRLLLLGGSSSPMDLRFLVLVIVISSKIVCFLTMKRFR
jgi:hypothetical protein